MRALAVVLIRLIGIYYLAALAIGASGVIAALQSMAQSPYGFQPSGLLFFVPPVVTIVILFALADPIARMIVPKRKEGEPEDRRLTQHGFMRMGAALIGVFIFLQGAREFLARVAIAGMPQVATDWIPLIGPALGLGLILWARHAPSLLPADLRKSTADDPA